MERLHRAAILTGSVLVIAVGLAGCTAGSASESALSSPMESAQSFTIPQTTNQPSDPPLPSDYDQTTNNQLTPEEASLNQLWATANGEVGEDATPIAMEHATGLRDFAAAITARCYPVRSADQVVELEELRSSYESISGLDAFEPAQAYFVRATELCM